jgi:hypothetical protein
MASKTFFQYLAVVTLAAAGALVALHFGVAAARVHAWFSMASVLLFVVVCAGLFYAGTSAARSTNRNAFTNLVSISVFGKMVLAMAVLLIYQRTALPQNEWFVGIFLWCYVVFTAFEVWFMTKLARMR